MMVRILFIILAFIPLRASLEGGVWDKISNVFTKPFPIPDHTIKILVVHDQPGVILEVKGKYKIFDPHTKNHISTRYVGKRKYIQPLQDGLKWGEEFPGVYQLLIVPDDSSSKIVVDGIEYEGAAYIYDIGGTISVVNVLEYDDYLRFLLSSPELNGLPPETLAAVAITARTRALYQNETARTPYWSVQASQIGYQGHVAISPTTQIEKAIEDTRHMVMSINDSSFAAQWPALGPWGSPKDSVIDAKITLETATELAKKGFHAAKILEKAFPGMTVQMMN